MSIFKGYFKIMKSNLPVLIMFMVVFLSLSVFYSYIGTRSQNASFEAVKTKLAFISYDTEKNGENTVLVDGLKNYISQYSEIIPVEDDPEKLQESLFFKKVDSIIRIPKGFTEAYLEGENPSIEVMSIPDSANAQYAKMYIDRYLNRGRLYIAHMEEVSSADIVSYLKNDLSKNVTVEVENSGFVFNDGDNMASHYNLMAFYLLYVLMIGVGITMLAFNKPELVKRNKCSPISDTNSNLQLLLGNLTFAVLCWVLGILSSFALYGGKMATINGLLYGINSFVLTLTALSISFLVASNIKSKETFQGIATILVILMSSLTGVFTPQEMLGTSILKIARFMPTYWFVKANDQIQSVSVITIDGLMPIFQQMLMVLSFGIAALVVTMLISKIKESLLLE
ncbi:ABC transporter permease [Alkaliphilus pronyensis]|uniref:ABC transporter permease n=1 Tax=Alkaliphilus pronyensis TaxID=1482732 RepID=A0A6I0F9C6_9FIRM|nr:ABC transporter permease [Alkaliphilus pronyensis]KAB3533481.1 ABC transporter permease [Alkaliphilus pronyensis]